MTSATICWCLGASLTLLELGCGHTETRTVAFGPTGSPGGDVAVFTSQAPPGGQELGAITARGGGVAGNDVRVLYEDLVRQAQALGGNAIVIESIKTGVNDEARPCAPDCDEAQAELRGKALRLPPEDFKGNAPQRTP